MSVDGVAKRGPEGGRIIITLEYTVPRNYWPEYAKSGKKAITDAIDCLRLIQRDYENGELSLEELIDGADGIDVQVGK